MGPYLVAVLCVYGGDMLTMKVQEEPSQVQDQMREIAECYRNA